MGEIVSPIRRRDAVRTRERIVAAAQEVFSSRDYTQARLSDIAAEAGVNQALLVRYFGSKDRLFETALAALLKQNGVSDSLSRDDFGVNIVRRLVGEDDGPRDPLSMVLHAVSDPLAQEIARRLMVEEILLPTAGWLGGEAAEARAAEILLLCAGLFTYRKLLPLPPFEGGMAPASRRWLEETLQALIDKPTA